MFTAGNKSIGRNLGLHMFEHNTHFKLLSFSKLSMNDASAIESVSDFLMADLNRINFKIEFMPEVHLERETGAKSIADAGSQAK